jgi:outer membrane immunogenic protein
MLRRISLTLLAATAIGVVASQGALAADLGHPVYKAPPPAPPPVQDWSGIYVGLEAGYGWGKQDFGTAFNPFFGTKGSATSGTDKFPCNFAPGCSADATIGSTSQSGWLFGGFVGAQKQWGSWVLGIETDFDGADIKGSSSATRSQVINVDVDGDNDRFAGVNQNHTINAKIDELGTARAKVGWAWSPSWMIYATGGMAWAHVKDDVSVSFSNTFCDECTPAGLTGGTTSFNGSGGASMFGWTIGAGVDWKWQIDQGSAWVFGIEYLHYEFPEHTLTLADNVFGSGGNFAIPNTSERVDVVKGRISYLFSIH